jgi:hypothetical protein
MSRPALALTRRGLAVAAAGAGALAAALHLLQRTPPEPDASEARPTPPARGGGYRLSEHVQHYYRTTRL